MFAGCFLAAKSKSPSSRNQYDSKRAIIRLLVDETKSKVYCVILATLSTSLLEKIKSGCFTVITLKVAILIFKDIKSKDLGLLYIRGENW